MASQARHESVSRDGTFASRNVVPQRGRGDERRWVVWVWEWDAARKRKFSVSSFSGDFRDVLRSTPLRRKGRGKGRLSACEKEFPLSLTLSAKRGRGNKR